jgi:hypothetical protein
VDVAALVIFRRREKAVRAASANVDHALAEADVAPGEGGKLAEPRAALECGLEEDAVQTQLDLREEADEFVGLEVRALLLRRPRALTLAKRPDDVSARVARLDRRAEACSEDARVLCSRRVRDAGGAHVGEKPLHVVDRHLPHLLVAKRVRRVAERRAVAADGVRLRLQASEPLLGPGVEAKPPLRFVGALVDSGSDLPESRSAVWRSLPTRSRWSFPPSRTTT